SRLGSARGRCAQQTPRVPAQAGAAGGWGVRRRGRRRDRAAKMDVKRWDTVRPEVRDADLPPLEEKAAEPLGQELGTTGEEEPVPRDLVRRLARAPELDAVTEVVIALALADEDERAEHEGIGLPVEHTILETETAPWPRAQLFRA